MSHRNYHVSRHTVEQILAKLCEVEVALSKGQAVAQACRALGITEQTYYRWHNEYGGLKVDQVKRLKDLERENTRLKRVTTDLALDKLILKEAADGNFSAQRADGRRWSTAVRRWASPNAGCAGYWGSPAPCNGISESRPMMKRR